MWYVFQAGKLVRCTMDQAEANLLVRGVKNAYYVSDEDADEKEQAAIQAEHDAYYAGLKARYAPQSR